MRMPSVHKKGKSLPPNTIDIGVPKKTYKDKNLDCQASLHYLYYPHCFHSCPGLFSFPCAISASLLSVFESNPNLLLMYFHLLPDIMKLIRLSLFKFKGFLGFCPDAFDVQAEVSANVGRFFGGKFGRVGYEPAFFGLLVFHLGRCP